MKKGVIELTTSTQEIYPILLIVHFDRCKVLSATKRQCTFTMNLLTLVLNLPVPDEERHVFEKALALLEPYVVARDNRDLFSMINLIETHPDMCEKVLKMTNHQVRVINSESKP